MNVKHWTEVTDNRYLAPGTQLELSHYPRVGQWAIANTYCEASHRAETNRVVQLRPDWPEHSWRPGVPSWEWIGPDIAFHLQAQDIVLALAEAKVTQEVPGYDGPWEQYLFFVQRFKPTVKYGWVMDYNLDVPFLLRQ